MISTPVVPNVAQTCDPSNKTAIRAALAAIAMGSSIGFTKAFLGDIPTTAQLVAASQPVFAIRTGRLLGYTIGGFPGSMDTPRASGLREPYWDFECYAIWRYSETEQHYDDADAALGVMEQSFSREVNAQGTCYRSGPVEGRMMPLVPRYGGGGAWIAAYLVVRAYEMLPFSIS